MENERFVVPRLDPSLGFSQSVLSSVAEAVNKIKNALQENQLIEQSNYVSVTDAAFSERLEKAMSKNFDYIRRKDLGLLNNGPKNGSQQHHGTNRSALFTGKAPVRLGVGSSVSALAPTSAAHAAVSGSGVAAAGNANAHTNQEPTSVYVSGLPTDITEEELEILFGALGRIKKVKIYTTPLGRPKGDALLTFVLAESAITACFKFNGLDIGDGHKISVTKAEFTPKGDNTKHKHNNHSDAINTASVVNGSAQPVLGIEYDYTTGGLGSGSSTTNTSVTGGSAVSNTEQGFHSHFVHSTSTKNDIGSRAYTTNTTNTTNTSNTNTTPNTITTTLNTTPSILYTLLPAETEAGSQPVVLILNAFDPANGHDDDPTYFDELETDMLLECCNFGKVRTIQLLTLPVHYLAALRSAPYSSLGSGAGGGGVLGGAIGVTFEVAECAEKCASVLRDRRFDGRVLKTHVLPPLPVVDSCGSSGNSGNISSNSAVSSNISGSAGTSEGTPILSSVLPPPPPPRPPSIPKPNTIQLSTPHTITTNTATSAGAEISAPDIEAISNDVDDFLSSLM